MALTTLEMVLLNMDTETRKRSERSDDELVALLGDEFLSYIFAGAPWRAGEEVARPVELAVDTVSQIVERLKPQYGLGLVRRQMLEVLARMMGDATTCERLREQCGGQRVLKPTGDRLVDAMLATAEVRYVFASVPISGEPRGSVATPWHALPWYPSETEGGPVATALAEEEVFAKVFGLKGSSWQEVNTAAVQVVWSLGSGGTLRLVSIPESIFSFAVLMMRAAGERDIVNFPGFLLQSAEKARELIRDRHATVAVVASLENMDVDPGACVSVPYGTLIDPSGLGRIVPWVEDGTTCAMVLDVEMRLTSCELWVPGTEISEGHTAVFESNMPGFQRAGKQVDKCAMVAQLAVLFASNGLPYLAPAVRSRGLVHPLSGGGSSWESSPFSYPSTVRSRLSGDVEKAIADASEQLGAFPESCLMAGRRLLSAVSARVDNLDAFVDAVICWESLLGSDGEVTFRLCASMAHVLEPQDVNRRRALFAELKALYEVRSKLLHGAKEPEPLEAARARNRAIGLAMDLLRAVLVDPGLRQEGDSSARSKRVLLGALHSN